MTTHAIGDGAVHTLSDEHMPHITTLETLRRHGYRQRTISWHSATFEHPTYGSCRDFDVIRDVPSASGLYLYTTTRLDVDENRIRIRYVGRTTHLWMITKGVLPGAGGRGGQRRSPSPCGRNAATYQCCADCGCSAGLEVRIWVQPVLERQLQAAEEPDICRWELRRYGLNRG